MVCVTCTFLTCRSVAPAEGNCDWSLTGGCDIWWCISASLLSLAHLVAASEQTAPASTLVPELMDVCLQAVRRSAEVLTEACEVAVAAAQHDLDSGLALVWQLPLISLRERLLATLLSRSHLKERTVVSLVNALVTRAQAASGCQPPEAAVAALKELCELVWLGVRQEPAAFAPHLGALLPALALGCGRPHDAVSELHGALLTALTLYRTWPGSDARLVTWYGTNAQRGYPITATLIQACLDAGASIAAVRPPPPSPLPLLHTHTGARRRAAVSSAPDNLGGVAFCVADSLRLSTASSMQRTETRGPSH